MKKNFLLLLFFALGFMYKPAQAQVGVNINIGAQPVWGPVGYDYVEYYYFPDIEVYYYVPTRRYIYLSNNNWIFSASLPYQYRNYNVYTGYKVVINEPKPYLHFHTHKAAYAKYKGYYGKQVIIKNSNEPKYYVVKGHPKNNGNGNNQISKSGNKGNGKGKSKGKH